MGRSERQGDLSNQGGGGEDGGVYVCSGEQIRTEALTKWPRTDEEKADFKMENFFELMMAYVPGLCVKEGRVQLWTALCGMFPGFEYLKFNSNDFVLESELPLTGNTKAVKAAKELHDLGVLQKMQECKWDKDVRRRADAIPQVPLAYLQRRGTGGIHMTMEEDTAGDVLRIKTVRTSPL